MSARQALPVYERAVGTAEVFYCDEVTHDLQPSMLSRDLRAAEGYEITASHGQLSPLRHRR